MQVANRSETQSDPMSNQGKVALTAPPALPTPDAATTSVMPHDGPGSPLVVRVANETDREVIYHLRHEVYARELHQHSANNTKRLTDALDDFNQYLVVSSGTQIVGFVSITPPGSPSFSMDKYFAREQLPFPVDDRLFEVRLLTVPQSSRRSLLALALMYASFRWVESHGGTRIMAIGRREVMSMYWRVGLRPVGMSTQAGAVTYELMQTTMPDVHASLAGIRSMLDRIKSEMSWQIGVPFDTPAPCYHGGEFFKAVGESFEHLEQLRTVINADVLDAWFPPSPKVIGALKEYLPALLRTSPPTECEGMCEAIAAARGVASDCILPGAGSSDLIFRALRHWLTPDSTALILDPTYGEYAHVLERVIGCHVERLSVSPANGYQLDSDELTFRLADGYDLVVLVNPNSPTGQHVPREVLENVLRQAPWRTRVWVDEAYIEYTGPAQSLETFAARSENVVVCKSLSKTYALSGARAAYLCASPHQLESLRAITPPWAVNLLGQVAAVKALEDPDYYTARYEETRQLRRQLSEGLALLGWEVTPSQTNFLLCHLPADGPDTQTLLEQCKQEGLFLRDMTAMGQRLGDRAVRIAVKDATTNARMLEILRRLLTSA